MPRGDFQAVNLSLREEMKLQGRAGISERAELQPYFSLWCSQGVVFSSSPVSVLAVASPIQVLLTLPLQCVTLFSAGTMVSNSGI